MQNIKLSFYSLALCSVFLIWVSCKKDQPDGAGLSFPRQFKYDSYYSGDMKVYVFTNSGFSEIPPSGSFINLKNDALNWLGDYKEVLVFDDINILTENTATLKNNIPGHDFFGLSYNADYTINGSWINYLLKSPTDNSTAEFSSQLADNNEALLQYARFHRYSYKKPNGTTGYWGIDIEGGNFFNNIPAEIVDIQSTHTFSVGDTLAIGYIVGKLL